MGLKMIKAQGGIFGWVSDSASAMRGARAALDARMTRMGGFRKRSCAKGARGT